jgi:predicted nucleic acid-binding protein
VVFVDSSVWIDYFNGRDTRETTFLDTALGTEPIAIGDLVLTEVLQGFRSEADRKSAERLLLNLTVYDILGTSRALKAVDNYRVLRRKGITIGKTIDTLIATFCIETRLPLLFSDSDFGFFVRHLGLRSALALKRPA